MQEREQDGLVISYSIVIVTQWRCTHGTASLVTIMRLGHEGPRAADASRWICDNLELGLRQKSRDERLRMVVEMAI